VERGKEAKSKDIRLRYQKPRLPRCQEKLKPFPWRLAGTDFLNKNRLLRAVRWPRIKASQVRSSTLLIDFNKYRDVDRRPGTETKITVYDGCLAEGTGTILWYLLACSQK
jgi:hypothetical protein